MSGERPLPEDIADLVCCWVIDFLESSELERLKTGPCLDGMRQRMAPYLAYQAKLQAENKRLSERLAGCHEFNQQLKLLYWLAASTHFEFGNVSIWKLHADGRWHVWKDEYQVDAELNEDGFETFGTAYRAAVAANWLPPAEAEQQGGG